MDIDTAQIMRGRISAKYVVVESGCWEWSAFRDRSGYGKVGMPRKGPVALAHRVSYEVSVGPIAPGLELDHLCRNPPCINPSHLEPVTRSENIRRGHLHGAFVTPIGQCWRGHFYDEENTYTMPNGRRSCRECRRIATRRHDAKRRPERKTSA